MELESSVVRRTLAALAAVSMGLWAGAADAQTQGESGAPESDQTQKQETSKRTETPKNAESSKDADTEDADAAEEDSETAPAAPVSFVAAPGIALYASSEGSSEWRRICLAPCELPTVPSPPFALSLDGADPVADRNSPRVTSGVVLEGQYRSRASTRNAGWIILGIGVPSSLTVIASGAAIAASRSGESNRTVGIGTAIGGGVAFLTSLIIGTILAAQPDRAHVHVRKR